jgi:20S proteasome subunit beta 2
LAADTRSTNGPIVADRNCEKIHYLSPWLYCCGAGTAADTEFTTSMIRSTLHLQSIESGRQPRVGKIATFVHQPCHFSFSDGYDHAEAKAICV